MAINYNTNTVILKIILFDDGNEDYEDYHNEWVILDEMFEGGKYKLMNRNNSTIIINSISSWKTACLLN
tara:strand:+ start:1208 stop:1414 length:207 start_codon:yes stop_codon:yes gene_type:complete